MPLMRFVRPTSLRSFRISLPAAAASAILLAATAGGTVPKADPSPARPATPPPPSASPAPRPAPALPRPNVLGLTAWAGGVDPKAASVDWIAGVELAWTDVEPEAGKIDWTKLDAAIGAVDRAGATAIPVLVPRSSWAGGTPREDWPKGSTISSVTVPADLEAWSSIVGKIVERYDGDGDSDMPGLSHPVRAWQLMPDLTGTWASTSPDTVAYLHATAKAVRGAQPRAATILGSLTSTDVDLLAVEADASTGLLLDGTRVTKGVIRAVPELLSRMSFLDEVLRLAKEDYFIVDVRMLDTSEKVVQRVRFLQDWFPKNEMGPKNVWDLYNAMPALPEGRPDGKMVATELVRSALLSIAAGSRHFGWPADARALPPITALAPFPIADGNGKQQEPLRTAFFELARRLDGLVGMEPWPASDETPKLVTIRVQTTSSDPFVAAWTVDGSPLTVAFPAAGKVTVTDALTGKIRELSAKEGVVRIEVGLTPLYLTGVDRPGQGAKKEKPTGGSN